MSDSHSEFIAAAVVPRDDHQGASLARAEAIRAAHPEVADASVYAAAVLGDEARVRSWLARDAGLATATGGPFGWDALTHLAFSVYLRDDPSRAAGFLAAATALLDAGAPATTGFFEKDHRPNPSFESVIYGAAGVAKDPALTRLFLERGADPNDGETPYHSPETGDNRTLAVLVESGRLTAESLTIMLVRKADWHDHDGLRFLLDHGADPNARSLWGMTPLQQAVKRDNAIESIDLLLDRGGDATLVMPGLPTAASLAARRGRADVLRSLARRGVDAGLRGVDALAAACALGDEAGARAIASREPAVLREAIGAEGGRLLAQFAANANAAGVALLLDLGVPVDAPFVEGDGYFGVAPRSRALHAAAWRLRPATVRLLLDRGADPAARDGAGRAPLALAVRACVDSFWTERRTSDVAAALLAAGAPPADAPFPSGYAEVDELLRRAGRAS